MTLVPTLGGTNAGAAGINNRGQVVGKVETPNVDPCSSTRLDRGVESGWNGVQNDTVLCCPLFREVNDVRTQFR